MPNPNYAELDRSRVRLRIVDDFKQQARSIYSEIEHYAEHFNDEELSDLNDVHHDLARIAAMVDTNTFRNS